MRHQRTATRSSIVVALFIGACATPTASPPGAAHARNETTTTNTNSAAASGVETTAGDSTAARTGIGYGSGH